LSGGAGKCDIGQAVGAAICSNKPSGAAFRAAMLDGKIDLLRQGHSLLKDFGR